MVIEEGVKRVVTKDWVLNPPPSLASILAFDVTRSGSNIGDRSSNSCFSTGFEQPQSIAAMCQCEPQPPSPRSENNRETELPPVEAVAGVVVVRAVKLFFFKHENDV
ncbi:uncharacterized protein G2W53_004080 [Senna tora]|uniref:Uncharacterized protein n=1 Tax=Senna tora TaxID=362788 RepID=A0A834XBQ1_9FABA|nr:uncharacterized protein G2W53_004080 [Senna tora]